MDRTEELVNLVIDAEATAEERAELERLLLTSPETRALYDATLELCRRLDRMPRLDMPKATPAVLPFRRRRKVVFGLAWAAAAAFILFVFLNNPISRQRDSAATMAPMFVVRQQGDAYALEPRVDERPVRVTVEFDPEKVILIGVSGGQDPSSEKTKVSFTLRDPSDRAVVLVRPQGRADWSGVRVSVERLP
jgi:hypothetical protein